MYPHILTSNQPNINRGALAPRLIFGAVACQNMRIHIHHEVCFVFISYRRMGPKKARKWNKIFAKFDILKIILDVIYFMTSLSSRTCLRCFGCSWSVTFRHLQVKKYKKAFLFWKSNSMKSDDFLSNKFHANSVIYIFPQGLWHDSKWLCRICDRIEKKCVVEFTTNFT